MKKLFVITLLMAFAMSGFAQQIHYDFYKNIESGQTLYFLKANDSSYNVTVTYPCYHQYYNSIGAHESTYYYEHEKPAGNMIIPSTITYNDTVYTINGIGNYAFWHCYDITSVSLPNTIKSIGNSAFYDCLGITTVVFGNNINSIGKEAFMACTALEQISELPETLTTIKQDAFRACTSLSGTIIIPPSLSTVEEGVFYNCNFTSIVFSEGVETVKSEAFCRNPLVSIYIPSTLTNISSSGFSCWGNPNPTLESIVVDEANPVYDSRGNCNALIQTATNTLLMGSNNAFVPYGITTIGFNAFQNLYIDSITIPNTVNRIEGGAFFGCNNISSIIIPSSVMYIGSGAFGCTALSSIICKSVTPPTAFFDEWEYGYENSFDGVNSNIPVYVPLGTSELYRTAPGWDYFTNFIETEMNLEGEWYYEILNDNGTITYQHLEYAADTTIGNERPKIIVRSNTIYDRGEHTEVTHEYILERDGKVYWWNKDLEEFTTLYDLTAEAGDEWEIKVGMESLTMHVDSVWHHEFEGRSYRILHVSDPDDLFSGDIVCGIGHLTSFFHERLMNRGKGYRVTGLRCYWVEGNLIFKINRDDCDAIYAELHNGIDEDGPSTGSGALTVYPNPANNILFVETRLIASLPDQQYHITNMMGQTLLTGSISAETQQIDITNLPAGMYFISVGGQTMKFVVQ